MTADLSALIARLEAAEEVTRDLAVEFATFMYADPEAFKGAVNYDPELWVERNQSPLCSLDAALALAERVCPDHHSSVGNLPVSDDADYEEHHHFGALLYSRYTKPYDALGHGATRALALVIATLRAKLDG